MNSALRGVLNFAASGVDRVASTVLLGRSERSRSRSRSESLGHEERLQGLAAISATWDPKLSDDVLFVKPPDAAPRLSPVRQLDGIEVVDATWPSGFAPFDAGIASRYLERRDNATATARLFLHAEPRPAAILIHGYLGGQYNFEERVWPIAWFGKLGLDVALFVLPFHGARGRDGQPPTLFSPPLFPGSDPRITNEGARQIAWDLRALAGFFRARGAPSVGAMGMSLGGYSTALFATADADLAFAVPMIPLASFADAALAGGRFVGTETEQRLQHDALERAHAAVSPLVRAPAIASDRMLVLAAEGDRITPVHHAKRIADHFGSKLEVLAGGHLLHFWRRAAFAKTARHLASLGVIQPLA